MNKLELGHELNLSQTIELMLSPRMLQMLKMLNLSYLELIQEIEKASEENVMLELEKPDRLIEYMKQISSERIPKKEIVHEELPGIETIADSPLTLEEHLLQQLSLEDVDEKEKNIAEMLISSMDSRGYLADYAAACKNIQDALKVTRAEIDSTLEIVQGFEPEGIGARDLKECLIIQVREMNLETPELEKVLIRTIEDHLQDLADRSFEKIAKALKIQKDGAVQLGEFIKNNLDPDPGAKFCEKAPCVIPSFYVSKEKDRYKIVNLEKTYGPVIKLSATYQKMLQDPKTDKDSVSFLKDKLEGAKDFLENLEKRHATIERIVSRVVEAQKKFLDKGDLELGPLMQKDLADEFGLHPSTISRALSNKYVQTPRGVFQLKYLCPREVKGITSERIKKLVMDIINAEDKKNPVSDEVIAQKLQVQGIALKRRTVAAYRKKLGLEIPSKRVKF